MINPKELIVDSLNPNHMSAENFKALIRNMKKYGFLVPVITNADLIIADGEHRWKAALEINMDKIPVIRLPINEVDRRILRQVMNKLRGIHDIELDMEEFNFIHDEGQYEELRSLLPDTKEFELMLSKQEKDPDDFEAEERKQKYNIQIGEIYQCGEHIVMCGDATNPEHMAKLMGVDKATMILTDPPYGVSYRGTNNPNGRAWEVIKGDELRGNELYLLIHDAFNTAHNFLIDNPAIYCFYATINHIEFESAISEAGYRVKQVLVWDKGHILGHSDYHWSHEPIIYAIKKGQNCTWYGDRKEKTVLNDSWQDLEGMKREELLNLVQSIREKSTIIRIRKDPAKDYIHPTQKPVALMQQLIRNSTEYGNVILDMFAGSGSVLIACELTKRKCRAMDLDPKYASACIERWENFTNQTAKKLTK